MKNLRLLPFIILAAGCQSIRPASQTSENPSPDHSARSTSKESAPVFIRSISTEPFAEKTGAAEVSISKKSDTKNYPHPVGMDDYDELRYKYSILTNTPVEELSNLKLLIFMEQWYGVRYRYGGTGRNGIDCSAFSSLLLTDVYKIDGIPRMSADQYKATRRISKRNLQEGDLVFFHTSGKGHRVTHVGVYLYNSRFVHASIAGVQISDLGEGYYAQHYVGAGRFGE